MQIPVRKLVSHAILPKRAHKSDAGLDIFSCEDIVVGPNERIAVRTGISFSLPLGYVGLVWDKSGISFSGVKTFGGVIDAGYRGEIKIILMNFGSKPFSINCGQKIAQLLVQRVSMCEAIEVSELDDTERGINGFGSTGK